jgi:hypothetical protein
MNKKIIVEKILIKLEADLVALKAAAMETLAAATGEESIAENQYDTRALEAGYLAGAQAKRLVEIEESVFIYKSLKLRDFDPSTPIGPTALVELSLDDKITKAFLTPAAGGMTLETDQGIIQVLTPKSPLGEALVGLKVGDIAIVEKEHKTFEYEIIKVS